MTDVSVGHPLSVATVVATPADPSSRPRGLGDLSLDAISVRFGKVQALRDVSIQLRRGEALMLVGPNGAGKSTLVHVLLGLVRPDEGRVSIDGKPVRVDRKLKEQLGYLPEAIAFSENLTGLQVLRFFAHARAVKRGRVDDVLRRVGLTDAAKRTVRGYSRGMRQRLGLAIAILAEPPLLVLDEPTGGLDQEGLSVLFGVLAEWRAEGRLALVATHDLTLLERRVDRVCVLKSGRRVALDTPAALRAQAGLPVRVTFSSHGDTRAIEEALRARGATRVFAEAGCVIAHVPPERLMASMDVGAEHRDQIDGLRVEEPGMDEVYEHFLREAEAET
ncbi:MAG: ABC transporter ATP-binding protein [Myxococcales bacterium]|nr:ABC transporter ATP-binding protein [Myxococcales bacterium]